MITDLSKDHVGAYFDHVRKNASKGDYGKTSAILKRLFGFLIAEQWLETEPLRIERLKRLKAEIKWDQLVEQFPALLEMQEYYRSLKPELRDGEPYFCSNEQQRRVVTKRILRDMFRGWTKSWPLENSAAFWEAYYGLSYGSRTVCTAGVCRLTTLRRR